MEKKVNESKIGYTTSADSKIYITKEAENSFKPSVTNHDGTVISREPFVAKNGICKVHLYNYRNRPNAFIYISIKAKTQNYEYISIEDFNEVDMLTEDLKECMDFINGLEKA